MRNKRLIIFLGGLFFFFAYSCVRKEKQIETYRSYWYSDDRQDSTLQSDFKLIDGKRMGEYHRYYPNGQLKIFAKYKDDKLFEIVNVYDTNGRNLDFGSLKNGNGCVKAYDEDGNLIRKGCYQNGLKEGNWDGYAPNGEVTNTTKYVKGKINVEGYEKFDFSLYD